MLTDPNEVDPRMIEWFNNNVLMGFTEDREKWASNSFVMTAEGENAKPWFANENYQGGYTGPVPIEAVETLFGWQAVLAPLHSYIATDDISQTDYVDDDGQKMRKVTDDTRRALLRSDTGDFLNVVSTRYSPHQYTDWLINNVAAILDDQLAIDSAGLLMGGGVAWVSVSLPETITTDVGFAIRPRLLAFTSHNGKHKTTYKRSLEAPVCSNSLDIERRRDKEDGTEMKWSAKHTSNSGLLIADARQALGILYQQAEEMVDFMNELTEWEVTNAQFMGLINQLLPVPETQIEDGKITNARAITTAKNKRAEVGELYVKDDRAAPWKGTALGVLQAFNTWEQQVRGVRSGRVERQMLNTLSDDVAAFDAIVLNSLAELCEREPVAVG